MKGQLYASVQRKANVNES